MTLYTWIIFQPQSVWSAKRGTCCSRREHGFIPESGKLNSNFFRDPRIIKRKVNQISFVERGGSDQSNAWCKFRQDQLRGIWFNPLSGNRYEWKWLCTLRCPAAE